MYLDYNHSWFNPITKAKLSGGRYRGNVSRDVTVVSYYREIDEPRADRAHPNFCALHDRPYDFLNSQAITDLERLMPCKISFRNN
ncbi:hypothetical protein HZH68_012190 [Vespula germanica]|uniref:Uncharacterized protein n=1 Tax=Vespula germanica TaxID=30212 RepID=A0A834MZ30_VESGE|nr:hypothetical protein HZH68_012190 [Vespula germanica]